VWFRSKIGALIFYWFRGFTFQTSCFDLLGLLSRLDFHIWMRKILPILVKFTALFQPINWSYLNKLVEYSFQIYQSLWHQISKKEKNNRSDTNIPPQKTLYFFLLEPGNLDFSSECHLYRVFEKCHLSRIYCMSAIYVTKRFEIW